MGFDLANIAIPLWSLLVFYGVFLLFFVIYSLFNLYHLLRFGTFGIGLFGITALFIGGTAVLLTVSFAMLSTFDWSADVRVSDYLQEGESGYLGF